jgi:hypothetical protein
MIRPDIPYRACANCTHIEHCPFPKYFEGEKITPLECPKSDKVKLTKRVDELIPKE